MIGPKAGQVLGLIAHSRDTSCVTLWSSVSVHRPEHPASQDTSSTRVGLTQMADWLPDTWPSYYQCYPLHNMKSSNRYFGCSLLLGRLLQKKV